MHAARIHPSRVEFPAARALAAPCAPSPSLHARWVRPMALQRFKYPASTHLPRWGQATASWRASVMPSSSGASWRQTPASPLR